MLSIHYKNAIMLHHGCIPGQEVYIPVVPGHQVGKKMRTFDTI